MTISSKAVVFLHTPLKINLGSFDVIYCYPQANVSSPLGADYRVIRLCASALAEDDESVYITTIDNVAGLYYNNSGDSAADTVVAALISGSLGFLDLTV